MPSLALSAAGPSTVPPSRPSRRWPILVALLPMVLGLSLLSSTLEDDSYITFWSAHALAESGEIVNYNGDRVEQSSTFAFVLLLAGLHLILPLDVPTIGTVVSLVFAPVIARMM